MAETDFDPEKEDLRDHLREDSDGSRAHRLVQALAARSKAVQAQANTESDAQASAQARKVAEALMLGASVIERLSPRLRA